MMLTGCRDDDYPWVLPEWGWTFPADLRAVSSVPWGQPGAAPWADVDFVRDLALARYNRAYDRLTARWSVLARAAGLDGIPDDPDRRAAVVHDLAGRFQLTVEPDDRVVYTVRPDGAVRKRHCFPRDLVLLTRQADDRDSTKADWFQPDPPWVDAETKPNGSVILKGEAKGWPRRIDPALSAVIQVG
jgi:hypothetical protein